ncbi:MAG: IS3 family transposase [Chitinophagaceae bacterium]|nr:IS3 family transposase [Chitinophagaceae bacterium]
MSACGECIFKKVGRLNSARRSCQSAKQAAKVIQELRQYHAQDLLLKAAGMARSTFYYYLKKAGHHDKDSDVKRMIETIYHQHKGRYGYRRITDALRNGGLQINHKRVARLMHECGLKSLVRVKKYKSYKGQQGKIARNLLNRKFKAKKPNQKWVTDVTEFNVAGSKLYLSPIMDLYNGEIISYNISQQPTFHQTMDMLEKALRKLPENSKPILHSDQGWQYQMREYQNKLRKRRIRQSMSRKGNCLDNASMESFFAILKSEMFYLRKFASIEVLKTHIDDYIYYYNNERIKQKLNGLSPVQYRTQAA